MGCATSYNACGANVLQRRSRAGVSPPSLPPSFNALQNRRSSKRRSHPHICTGPSRALLFKLHRRCGFNQLGNFESQKVWSLWSGLDNGALEADREAHRV